MRALNNLKMKLQYWSGIQAVFAREAAPALEFVILAE